MRDLNAILIFTKVAETRSFTQAAQQLGLTQSAVSKAVTRLEQDLGVRLLHRTTRSVSTTNDGMSFLERCQGVLADIDEAENALGGSRQLPHGRLRVQLPVALGRRIIMPAMREFAANYPGLVIDVELSDRMADLAYEGLDAAVVIGGFPEGRLIARKLCDLRFFACAAPAYLDKHGEPSTPDDLARHRCLSFLIPQTGRYRDWQFACDGHGDSRQIVGQFNMNHGESMLDAAIAGEGIAMLSSFMIQEAVQAGTLRVLLQGFATTGPPVHVLFLERRNLSPRVRAFVQFITELIPDAPSWNTPGT